MHTANQVSSHANTVQAQLTETISSEFNLISSSLQSKGKYEVASGALKSPDELVDMYQTLISKYPAVVALIDPFRREVSSKHIILWSCCFFLVLMLIRSDVSGRRFRLDHTLFSGQYLLKM